MRKLLLMAAGYIGGVFVSSLYNKKKPEDLKNEFKESRQKDMGEIKVFWNSFVETHKNLIADIEAEVMTEKNKKLFESKKNEILKIALDYKKEAESIIKNLQVKGKEYLEETVIELEDLYYGKKDQLESLKDVSPEKIEELKSNLLGIFEEMKKKIKNMK